MTGRSRGALRNPDTASCHGGIVVVKSNTSISMICAESSKILNVYILNGQKNYSSSMKDSVHIADHHVVDDHVEVPTVVCFLDRCVQRLRERAAGYVFTRCAKSAKRRVAKCRKWVLIRDGELQRNRALGIQLRGLLCRETKWDSHSAARREVPRPRPPLWQVTPFLGYSASQSRDWPARAAAVTRMFLARAHGAQRR